MIQLLMEEHGEIERMLDALETRVAELGRGEFPTAFFTEALDFFRDFADGRHHQKEEDVLFPRMIAAGLPSPGGPVDCMLKDHQAGRAHVAAMRASLAAAGAGDSEAIETVRSRATAYIGMLRDHIWKEDNILFPMAEQLVGREELELALSR